MPNMCTCCGKEPADDIWPVFAKYNYSLYVVFSTYSSSTFFVPVCDSCKSYLDKDSKRWYRASIGSLVFLLIVTLLATSFVDYLFVFFMLGMITLVIFFIASVKRRKYWGGSGIVSFNGRHFNFRNKEFLKRFSELNPSFVWKPKQ